MKNPETHPDLPKFVPGMLVKIKSTSEHHLNGEYLPNGITGVIEKIENGKIYVAYRIPGESPKRDKAQSTIFPFNPAEIEILTS